MAFEGDRVGQSSELTGEHLKELLASGGGFGAACFEEHSALLLKQLDAETLAGGSELNVAGEFLRSRQFMHGPFEFVAKLADIVPVHFHAFARTGAGGANQCSMAVRIAKIATNGFAHFASGA